MAYGDPLVTTSGPSYGQSIVRNVGEGGGSSFENPYPDPVTWEALQTFDAGMEQGPYGSSYDPSAFGGAALEYTDSLGDGGNSNWNWYSVDDLPNASNYVEFQLIGKYGGGGAVNFHDRDADGSRHFVGAINMDRANYPDDYAGAGYIRTSRTVAGSDQVIRWRGGVAAPLLAFYTATPVAQGAHLSGGGITAAAIYAQLELMGIFAAA